VITIASTATTARTPILTTTYEYCIQSPSAYKLKAFLEQTWAAAIAACRSSSLWYILRTHDHNPRTTVVPC
jgi:hypothetical protein